jgi:hypothetical protein
MIYVHTHNLKKLFLLFFLLLPTIVWPMKKGGKNKDKEDLQPFYLVVDAEYKYICRASHLLLDSINASYISENSSDARFQNLQAVRKAYTKLGVKRIKHKDFRVKREENEGKGKFRLLFQEDAKKTNLFRVIILSNPFYEVIRLRMVEKDKKKVKECCEQLPFKPKVCTVKELIKWSAQNLYKVLIPPEDLLDLNG